MIRGFFRGVGYGIVAVLVCLLAANAWVLLSAKPVIFDSDNALEVQKRVDAGESYDCIVVLGASVMPDGSLSPILENRVQAGIELFNQGLAPALVMSGDGRSEHYDEPAAMKAYAIEQGVPASAVFCDPGGYHTYDTMWRLKHVYGAQSALVVTQEYHLYRAVFDGKGTGMVMAGAVSDRGTYDDQLWYDVREFAARIADVYYVLTNSIPDNPYACITQ